MRYVRSVGDIALKDDRASKGVTALVALAFVALSLGAAQTSSAHPGGLNAEGCHSNRKTGDYHCHRAGTQSAPRQLPGSPVRVVAIIRIAHPRALPEWLHCVAAIRAIAPVSTGMATASPASKAPASPELTRVVAPSFSRRAAKEGLCSGPRPAILRFLDQEFSCPCLA